MRQLGVLLMLPVALAFQSPDDASTMQRMAAQSNFVFQGTVNRLNATTEPQMAASPSTAVVRVDRLIQGQDMVSDIVGKEITVQLLKPRSVTVGRPLMFFSNIAVMGKSLAVKEVAHYDVTRSSTIASQTADYARAKPERDLQSRIASADVIVTGTVDSVAPQARAREGPQPSEHDAEWTQATITAQSTEKGAPQQRVTVWFAASDDIRWFRSPKLKPGQAGVFLLHRATDRERDQPSGFAVVDPLDVQPATQRDRVRQLAARGR